MIHKVTREAVERIIQNQEDMILSRYITIEGIIRNFSNLDIFKGNNPSIEIDYFSPNSYSNGDEKAGVKYVDERKIIHYMYIVSSSDSLKKIIVGRQVGALIYLLLEEFSNNTLVETTIIAILVRDINRKRKGEKLRIRYKHKFDFNKDYKSNEVSELDIMCIEIINKSIKAFNKLMRKSN